VGGGGLHLHEGQLLFGHDAAVALLQSLGPRHVGEFEAEEPGVAQEHLVLLARQGAHHLNAALIDESSSEVESKKTAVKLGTAGVPFV
jgi:hypothetical protein